VGPGVTATGRTLVWLDAHEATIVSGGDGEIVIDHIESDVPDHHRSTGHVRHDPGAAHSGLGAAPRSAGETHRQEHLDRYLRLVADRLPVADDLTILGPGTVREHLADLVRGSDRRHHRVRTVVSQASDRRTDRQLVARLSREAGVEPRKRTVGAYRWSGRPPSTRSGHREAVPTRVAEKPPRTLEEAEEIEA
jgi:hypothetical protein